MSERIHILLVLFFSVFFVVHLLRRLGGNAPGQAAAEPEGAAEEPGTETEPAWPYPEEDTDGLEDELDEEDDSEAATVPLPENLDELIAIFNSRGSITFRFGRDKRAYDLFLGFIQRQAVPTYTTVDKEEGAVCIHRRLMGSME